MRLRNKEKEKAMYLNNSLNTINPELVNKKPNSFFKNDNDVEIEIGCGKGQFILAKAIQNPHINYIAVEKELTVIGTALKKTLKLSDGNLPKNLLFLSIDAKKLCDLFKPNLISVIYLNFSDPWPKKRHEKYRLTYISFQQIYAQLLKQGGSLIFKSDNDGLFEYSKEAILDARIFDIVDITNDLYNSKFIKNNIPTEYENRFVSLGKNINYISCIKKE